MNEWLCRVVRCIITSCCLVGAPATMVGQGMLTRGTVLVYTTPEGSAREWVVEEATADVSHGGRTGCMRVRYAAGGPTAGPEERLTCVAGDSLFRWSSARDRWELARLIVPYRGLELPLPVGSARYVTQAPGVDTISSEPVPVIRTIVITRDSSAVAVRRLVEDFAPGLGTATWGRFEVREVVAGEEGWRVVQEFRLAAIRRPGTPP